MLIDLDCTLSYQTFLSFHILKHTGSFHHQTIRHRAMATSKTQCFTCDKFLITYNCKGCSQDFCFNHLTEHRQTLGKQFDEIENDRDQFQQILIEQKQDPTKHFLIQQINQWENDSIEKIKQTANECKQILIEQTNIYSNKI